MLCGLSHSAPPELLPYSGDRDPKPPDQAPLPQDRVNQMTYLPSEPVALSYIRLTGLSCPALPVCDGAPTRRLAL
jgi:hypothetical protein